MAIKEIPNQFSSLKQPMPADKLNRELMLLVEELNKQLKEAQSQLDAHKARMDAAGLPP